MTESLKQFIESATGESHLRIEQDYGDGFVRLRSAEAERRQAKQDIRCSEDIVIEMLRNSRDAGAKNIYVASWKEDSLRNITVLDDGAGIPDFMRTLVFEARVTNKLDTVHSDVWGLHGRGMALYAIRENTQQAYVASSKPKGGCSIHVVSDTTILKEKKDQSTLPVFIVDGSGTVSVRGPKNIARTLLEFAYVERNHCTLYLGSPAEIAAALWNASSNDSCNLQADQNRRGSGVEALFDSEHLPQDVDSLDVCKRLSLAHTPEEFSLIASALALPLSERTARRIMNGEVNPAQPLREFMKTNDVQANPGQTYESANASEKPSGGSGAPEKDYSCMGKIKFSPDDLEAFSVCIKQAYAELAQGYYLDAKVEPEVRVRKGMLHISLPLISDD